MNIIKDIETNIKTSKHITNTEIKTSKSGYETLIITLDNNCRTLITQTISWADDIVSFAVYSDEKLNKIKGCVDSCYFRNGVEDGVDYIYTTILKNAGIE